jgi:ABC-2 type transport system permease protein
MTAVVRVELIKLLALWRARAALLVVLVAPPLVALVLQLQSGLPTDALFGRWVQEIGLAFPLVLLSSVAPWGVPVLASLIAGDVLSSEHAHGTWATLLGRTRSPWQLFWGKAAVAAVATVVLVGALATSTVVSGLLVVGRQDLVGLSGQPVGFTSGLGLVALAWATTLPTALAVSSFALLVSAATRNSLVGVAVPPLLAGALGLAGLLAPLGGLRPFLLTPGLTSWHGLLLEQQDAAPALRSGVVALGYGALLLGVTVLLLRRRDWVRP